MTETPRPGGDVTDALEIGPGRQLRRAREAKGMSRQDVARRLRLTSELVAAMEEDDFERLPEPIYTIGYLRNYARVLGIAAEPVVAAYERAEIEPPPIVTELVMPPPPGLVDRTVRAAVLVVLGALLIGVAAWWWQGDEDPAVEVAGTGTEAAEPPRTPEPVKVALPAQPPAEPVEAPSDERPEEAPPAESPPEEPELAAPEPVQSHRQGVVRADEAESRPIQPADTRAQLTLILEEDSWVEITDAAGKRLVYALLPAGDHRSVAGAAPFEVFLGYAPGVRIQYNGQVFDHSRYHRRGNVARFSLGPQDTAVATSVNE